MASMVGRSVVDLQHSTLKPFGHGDEENPLLSVDHSISHEAPGVDLPRSTEMQQASFTGVIVDTAQSETRHEKEDDRRLLTMEEKMIGGPGAAADEQEKVVNGNLSSKTATSSTAKRSDSMDAKSEADYLVLLNSEFTIEASVWPTLTEARNQKPSKREVLKSAPTKKTECAPLTSETTERKQNFGRHSASSFPSAKQKPAYKRGNMPTKLTASEIVPSHQNQISRPPNLRGNQYAGKKSSFAVSHRVYNHNTYNSPSPKWHNNVHLRGNGHHGWQYGYGNGQTYNYFFAPPEQQFAPLHVQQPFVNIPPTFYNIPNFQVWHYGNYLAYVPPIEGHGVHNRHESMSIQTALQRQIEYYFSDENLFKDDYLRSMMDNEGFVPISVIAKFNRVRSLTSSIVLILEALRKSSIIQVKEDKIRRAYDWQKFLITSQTHYMKNEVSNSRRVVMQDSIQQPRNDATSLKSNKGLGALSLAETDNGQDLEDVFKAHASANDVTDRMDLFQAVQNESVTSQLSHGQPMETSIEYESGICSSPWPRKLLREASSSSSIETLCTSFSCLTSPFPNKKNASQDRDLVDRQLGSYIAV